MSAAAVAVATLDSVLERDPVIPVVVLDKAADAVPLAHALLDGGIGTIELTLRTPAALTAIERIAAKVPEIAVGAGTVLSAEQARDAQLAGASFLVTPGATPTLLDALEQVGVPFLPGCATASELLALHERGIRRAKFFPAETAGGTAALKALGSVFDGVRFCPTGGITPQTAPAWLALDNVACVGGSWIAPRAEIAAHEWDAIEQRAREAVALRAAV
ncbi:bifunctional 4-hydroxy-2-oxoglutarate aldolase/2-dehydro-3-deoxy-phosphogluconate aldolase [Conexibacter sp. JD483]|uniref:bifunctional 4-hydroxy-2-oxoglutarate aldolase/2-dehydro-3-deoxy-phosphogluconate aldolase n=1 Tax=unclassified Conexibacter TaxID=2627773 RepID=UPI00271A73E7|nr:MULTISPECIES: bifunctional 4-hydroxy-2-oxoglutarate aldolase/2-dehydro-3-deoxy-phosphogluconate aldolase [unclassified Conexibacter]MDO8187074.1 bifunctional 4-hydroxy-2-oxoglutarate aldolase/2-dehydro-3-deoxy-phosphogluconate aldolase [Conexibacter sp. CPCC 205706]MDO8200932.1 bifunctional 4-hydroxy-2-oxoglutarate aldolase/2-dehydro-3-deoxy-phosphogluconate aldolase [Conexibacter sp. CPCC 205762]MDR9371314.1 bifunctional 4-hydroxy-2-oxoglutarate aldolase/2-dehydro-3-deoxy-phosphogluconate al